ncbi:MAB_1171c family putative transporter [Actinopolyspora saharensis]|uniref:MAB_1171c family putative transporter n=1 Tax=Actinopolyspora saharensis TaxID=995062 RepID=UPI003F678292
MVVTPVELLELVMTGWFGYRLVRSPRDRGLWVIVVALVLLLLGEAFVISALRTWSEGVITAGMGKLIQNCALVLGFCAVLLFFLLSASGARYASGRPEERPRVPLRGWCDGAAAVVVCVVLTLSMAATPPRLQAGAYPASGRLQDAALDRPEVVAFYAVALVYFTYSCGAAAFWAVRYGRESGSRVRFGLWLAAAGMVLFGLASAGRGVYVAAAGLGAAAPDALAGGASSLIEVGAVLWISGLLAVGVAARWATLRVWLHHRRQYRALRPLWERLHRAFPEDALDHTRREPGRLWRDRFSAAQVHRAFWRRAIECRDGLSKLSPWLRDVGCDPEADPAEQAEAVQRALELRASGHTPSSSAPLLVAAPSTTAATVDTDVSQLVRLARALDTHD